MRLPLLFQFIANQKPLRIIRDTEYAHLSFKLELRYPYYLNDPYVKNESKSSESFLSWRVLSLISGLLDLLC